MQLWQSVAHHTLTAAAIINKIHSVWCDWVFKGLETPKLLHVPLTFAQVQSAENTESVDVNVFCVQATSEEVS